MPSPCRGIAGAPAGVQAAPRPLRPMWNIENSLTYAPIHFEIVSHMLMMGIGAHMAGLVYFLLSRERVAPRYRMATVASTMIMLTSGLMLLRLAVNWQSAFALDPDTMTYALRSTVFSNGFRYVNWLITIPLLLVQVVIVVGLQHARFWRVFTTMVVAAVGMILTGYVGQFFERTDTTMLLVWGTVSTVFYVWLLVVVWRTIGEALPMMPAAAAQWMRWIRIWFVVTWSLYPGGYLVPVVLQTADAVVARQTIYTIADVTSKVLYGLMISRVAQILSAAEGYEPAAVIRERLARS